MEEIKDYCTNLARQGVYGHELMLSALEHFNDPKTIVTLLMDASPLAKHMMQAIADSIRPEIINAVVAAQSNINKQHHD